MMRGIKNALAFLFGVVYASGWWLVFTVDWQDDAFVAPSMLLIVGSVFIVWRVAEFMFCHWDDD